MHLFMSIHLKATYYSTMTIISAGCSVCLEPAWSIAMSSRKQVANFSALAVGMINGDIRAVSQACQWPA